MKLHGWFRYQGRWHASAGPVDDGWSSVCAIVLVDNPQITQATEDEPVPPGHCTRCLVSLAMEDCEDEPLDDALARGFLPYDGD